MFLQRLLDQNNQVNFELFFSSYYDKIFPHINTDEQKPTSNTASSTEQPQVDEMQEHEPVEEDNNAEEEEDADLVTPADNDDHTQAPPPDMNQQNKYDEETQRLIDESDQARRSYEEADKSCRDIDSEISDGRKKLELDVGANNEFASMIDQCFEYEDREYIYKMCPYEKTVQKSKSNQGETSIGVWKGWNTSDDPAKKYTLMQFDNGLACWNGPQRSTNVFITCGIENKVTSVSEPNRCEVTKKNELTFQFLWRVFGTSALASLCFLRYLTILLIFKNK